MLCVLSPVYGSQKDLTSVIYQFTKQTYKGDRILIILDDSPTKAPQSFFDNFDMTYVCYIHQSEKKPISMKRQILKDIALKDFGGMYMVCMDTDDIYNKNYLSSMVSLLKAGNHLVSCKDLIYFVPSSHISVYKKTITTKNFAIHAALGFTKEYALNHNYKTTVKHSEILSFTNNFSRNVTYLPGIHCLMIHCHKGTLVDHCKMFNSKNALPQSVQDQLVKEYISEDPKIKSLVLPNKFVSGLSYVTKKIIPLINSFKTENNIMENNIMKNNIIQNNVTENNVTENNVIENNVIENNDDIEILDGGYIPDIVKPLQRDMSGSMSISKSVKKTVEIVKKPVEPVKPIELKKPVEPVKPIELKKPVEPVKPIELVKKTVEHVKPIELVKKTVEHVKQVEPVKPIELVRKTVEPVIVVEPIEPMKLVEPVKPIELVKKPVEPVKQVEPTQPVKPVEPMKLVEPVKPIELVKKTVEPVKPVETMQPVEPVKPMQSVEPVKPVEPMKLVEPVKPVETMQPVEPVKPMQPVEPVKPMQPVEPVKPMQPVEPVKQVEPSKPAL
jgi:hypothetical protein